MGRAEVRKRLGVPSRSGIALGAGFWLVAYIVVTTASAVVYLLVHPLVDAAAALTTA